MKTIELSIEGMHCGGCVQRVTDAVKKAGGIPEKVEVGAARLQIEEEKVPTILSALDKMGFDARVKGAA